jgi:hypothetical protein
MKNPIVRSLSNNNNIHYESWNDQL